MIVLIRSLLKRVLTAAGLARIAEVEHERRAAAAIRAAERTRGDRAGALASSRLQAAEARLHAAHERIAEEHAGRNMLQGVLRHYLVRLTQAEAEISGRLAGERRVKLAQLAIGARTARRRELPSSAAAARAEQLAAISKPYATAAARWRRGDIPAEIRRGTVAGLRWALPAGAVQEDAMADGVLDPAWLPLQDLAAVRHFTVGGVMLDVGGGVGATSIPRLVLGDFARAYVSEADEAKYLCLVGNTLENQLEGRVLPDRVGFAGGTDTGISLDEWTDRLHIPVDRVRFVRLATQAAQATVLEGASRLLTHRQIVWQLEVDPASLETRALDDLCALLAARFTHVTEIGGVASTEWHRASEVAALLRRMTGERRTANLLLFNLRGGSTRKRRVVAPPPPRAESAGRPAVISILHSTARLPDGWRPAMEAFLSKAVHPELVEYILAIDEDQAPPSPPVEAARWRRFEVVKKGVKGPAAACNVAAQAARGDLFVQVADDYFPPTAWDEALRAAVPDFEDEVVLDVENSDGSTWLLPFSMLTRKYFERYGYIFYPGYHGLGADNEFTEQARRDRVVRSARHIVFEHRHVDRGLSVMDAIYERQKQHYEQGQALFKKRQAQGFPKWPD